LIARKSLTNSVALTRPREAGADTMIDVGQQTDPLVPPS
jgi:hypothetical protein